MKKYVIAIAIAFSALFGLSVQASPLASETALLKSEATTGNAVQKVQHWRWGSGGWRGGHWRWGSRGWHGRCRVRCNRWRCWRVCW